MLNDVELLRQAHELDKQASELAHSEGFNAEKEAEFDRIFADANAKRAQAKAIQRANEAKEDETRYSSMNDMEKNASPAERSQNEALRKLVVGEYRALEEMNLDGAGVKFNRNRLEFMPNRTGLIHPEDVRMAEARAVTVLGNNTSPLQMFPEDVLGRVEVARRRYNSMESVAERLVTSDGNIIRYPVSDDTHNVGILVPDNQTSDVGEEDVVYRNVPLYAYQYSSEVVAVSEDMMDDATWDVTGHVSRAIGERIGRIIAQHFTHGDGSSKPRGIVNYEDSSNQPRVQLAGATDTPDYDFLVDMMVKVDPAYYMGATFMFNNYTKGVLMKLKDTLNRPVWTNGFTADAQPMLLGYPVVLNDNMANPGSAGNKFMLFGDLSTYVIREARGIQMYRLEEIYRRRGNQVGFVAFARYDGQIVDPMRNVAGTRKYAVGENP